MTLSNLIDEWGRYTDGREELKVDLIELGVIEAIQRNSPTVIFVKVKLDQENAIDWSAVGEYLGGSKHIKHLHMELQRDSAENFISLCSGLAANKSIESLRLHVSEEGIPQDMFRCLFPFFSGNDTLESFAFSAGEGAGELSDSTHIIHAMNACPSLKLIDVHFHSGCTNLFMQRLVQSIFTKPGVHHISLSHCFISSCLSFEIKKALSDENCTLKSIQLYDVKAKKGEHISTAISGLSMNESLECFSFFSPNGEFIGHLMKNLGKAPLKALKKVRLCSGLSISFVKNPIIKSLMHQIPALECLTLESFAFDSFTSLLTPSTTLQRLRLNDCIENDAQLMELSSCINSSSLRALDIVLDPYEGDDCTSHGWQNFVESLDSKSMEEMYLNFVPPNDGVIGALSDYIVSNQGLKVIAFPYCSVGPGVPNSIGEALESHKNLEVVDISGLNMSYSGVNHVAHCLSTIPNLKQVIIELPNPEHFDIIPILLDIPTLEAITITIGFTLLTIETRMQTVMERIAISLQTNVSLKELEIRMISAVEDYPFGITVDWSPFFRALCNNSSINATYESNHIIQSIIVFNHALPHNLQSMLRLNKKSNKRLVALEKIMQTHSFEDINFGISTLPLVLSLVGSKSVEERGLCHEFSILRKVPHVIQNAKKSYMMI